MKPSGPAAQRPSGPAAQRPSGPAAQRPSGPAAQRPSGPAAQRPSGPAAQRPSGPAAQRPSGPAAQRPSGPAAQRPSGPAAQRPELRPARGRGAQAGFPDSDGRTRQTPPCPPPAAARRGLGDCSRARGGAGRPEGPPFITDVCRIHLDYEVRWRDYTDDHSDTRAPRRSSAKVCNTERPERHRGATAIRTAARSGRHFRSPKSIRLKPLRRASPGCAKPRHGNGIGSVQLPENTWRQH